MWGPVVLLVRYLTVAGLGALYYPESLGYLLFSVPVVVVSGAVVGVLCGAVAAAVAPLARRGRSADVALLRCAALYVVAVTVVLLAFALERRRAERARTPGAVR
ncbi:hypothetical protein [Cellulomonas pakistanensis]|uniref:Uncharacterized protein n=1 Tax=Cellulomonas pakistanensis TaxID=992287 RepID=A0A919PDK6_9CELL|nr:hypothetical protein [Cellulomonas pakistanensis]GIG36949.1 hypothetical protein Cpa01nite_23300 [Cellulomonas pakistanensis]